MTAFARFLAPAMAGVSLRAALRAGAGAFVGIVIAATIAWLFGRGDLGLVMIAPFGASAVLLFAVPNSPLAQPWSAIMGNGLSAVAGMVAIAVDTAPPVAMAVAVGLAITFMMLGRALHPPGGAVALTVALSPDFVRELGWMFPLVPVMLGTALLVAVAVPYAHLTGRRYPFRQGPEANSHGTTDTPALERLLVSRAELAALLQTFRQSANIGVEDLARLVAAAETLAAKHRLDGILVADIMSRDLLTVGPDTTLGDISRMFVRHDVTSLPVVTGDGTYLGQVFQLDVVRGHETGARSAQDIMTTDLPHVHAAMATADLLPLLASGRCDAVPVLDGHRLTGIVTQTDLIAALAKDDM